MKYVLFQTVGPIYIRAYSAYFGQPAVAIDLESMEQSHQIYSLCIIKLVHMHNILLRHASQ